MAWVKQYFSDIPAVELAPKPDISEQPQTAERKASRIDPLAPKPAYAVAYRMPERNSEAYYAMGLIDQILLQGDDSLLHQKLVEEMGISSNVFGGINMLGNMFNYQGPMLWTAGMIHEPEVTDSSITTAIDEVINSLQTAPVSEEELDRARVKLRSQLYDTIDGSGIGKLDLLATFALFDDDPSRINRIESAFAKVTPELIQQTAKTYLTPQKRTIFTVIPESMAQENAQGEAK